MVKSILLMILLFVASQAIAQKNIEFTYEIEKEKTNESLINVSAKIINTGDENIYFLSESCNGLYFYLMPNSTSISTYIRKDCEVTLPRKIEIKANSEYSFNLVFKVTSDLEKFKLDLKLYLLNQTYKVEGKNIYEVKNENSQSVIILDGPLLDIN